MALEIYDASPKAQAKIKTQEDKYGVEVNTHHRAKYPFDRLEIGKCFIVPIAEAKEASLRISALQKAKATGKKFTVLKHDEYGCFEIARIE